MKDVAKRAGVSHGTVSNVINGVESVSIDKVRRVEAAMRELDYEPNAVARSLKMSNSKQFDVILPNIAADSLSYIYSCISSVAAREGYTANLYITNDDKYIETNFLNHVLTYNKPGGRVDVTVVNSADGARLIVADTGIGIAPEAQSRVFERFYRVDKSHSGNGTGLGLSIVKHGAAYLGARVTLESEAGKGSTFSLVFPRTLEV